MTTVDTGKNCHLNTAIETDTLQARYVVWEWGQLASERPALFVRFATQARDNPAANGRYCSVDAESIS